VIDQAPATIRTYRTGRSIALLAPQLDAIAIEDIACALSRQCRFVGHAAFHYSVAQHSILASYWVPREAALPALLHDGQEAYLGDVSGPLKGTALMAGYRVLEALWQRTIFHRFGLYGPVPACVHEADAQLLCLEQVVLQGTAGAPPAWAEPWVAWITPWTPDQAEEWFLFRFRALTAER